MLPKSHHRIFKTSKATLSLVALLVLVFFTANTAHGQDSLDRLLKKANLKQEQSAAKPKSTQQASPNAFKIPSEVQDSKLVTPAAHAQEYQFNDVSGFSTRVPGDATPSYVVPKPIGYGKQIYDPDRLTNPWNPNSKKDEYVYDGSDRAKKVQVDQSWNIYGLDTEDTIGHFDTLDGRRLVTPSNRVAIYAPRFGAVRKVDGLINAQRNLYVGAVEERTPVAQADGSNGATTSKQHLALERFDGRKRASGIVLETRGVVADNVTHLFGIRNAYEPYENLAIIRVGRHENSQSARLKAGLQAAQVWEDDLGLQVAVQKAQPVIVNDISKVQQLVTIESDDDAAILRVTKVASKIAARPGEKVDFTIRFDNLSGRKIGNVTIIDNLTRRLEYVEGTAECTLNADFVPKENDGGSLMLKWDITDPVPANTGGIIRFQCRVR